MSPDEHVPTPAEEWGMAPDGNTTWCKRCGYLLVRRDGTHTQRMAQPCSPARIALRRPS